MDGEEPIERPSWQDQTEGMGGVSMDRGTVQEEYRARIEDLRHKHRELPTQYRGYEALMDTFDDPAVNIPQGNLVVVVSSN